MIKFIQNDILVEDTKVVFSRTVVTITEKHRVDNYTADWRKRVEFQLNQLGLNDNFIAVIVSGYYDHKPQLLKSDCIKYNVDFYSVWKIIK